MGKKETSGFTQVDYVGVIKIPDSYLVHTGTTHYKDELKDLWKDISGAVGAKLVAWCKKKGYTDEDQERWDVFNNVKPELYLVNLKTGRLQKIEKTDNFNKYRRLKTRLERQFAFLDSKADKAEVLQHLADALLKLHGDDFTADEVTISL